MAAGSVLGPAPAGAVEPGRVSTNLGTNLGGVTYYDGVVPWADLVKQAGDWIPQTQGAGWGHGLPLRLRADGWPSSLRRGQYASLPLAEAHYPQARFRVSWRGKGSFEINGTRFSGRNGRGTVELDGSALALLDLRRTSPRDPVRGVRVVAPGQTQSGFREAYLAQLKP